MSDLFSKCQMRYISVPTVFWVCRFSEKWGKRWQLSFRLQRIYFQRIEQRYPRKSWFRKDVGFHKFTMEFIVVNVRTRLIYLWVCKKAIPIPLHTLYKGLLVALFLYWGDYRLHGCNFMMMINIRSWLENATKFMAGFKIAMNFDWLIHCNREKKLLWIL